MKLRVRAFTASLRLCFQCPGEPEKRRPSIPYSFEIFFVHSIKNVPLRLLCSRPSLQLLVQLRSWADYPHCWVQTCIGYSQEVGHFRHLSLALLGIHFFVLSLHPPAAWPPLHGSLFTTNHILPLHSPQNKGLTNSEPRAKTEPSCPQVYYPSGNLSKHWKANRFGCQIHLYNQAYISSNMLTSYLIHTASQELLFSWILPQQI